MAKTIDLTGQQIGKLTVLGRDTGVEEKKNNNTRYWKCQCECKRIITLSQKTLLTESSVIRSCGCVNIPNPNYTPKKMSAEELQSWNELYEYVKIKVMDYSDSQCLSNQMVLRLKGLATGKYLANNKSVNHASYSYDAILTTFKFCMQQIQKSFRMKRFEDDNKKFNYACAIVANNINTVIARMDRAKQTEKQSETLDLSHLNTPRAQYQRKTEDYRPELEELW